MPINDINVHIKSLSTDEISNYLKVNDDDLFQKLSDRTDIKEYAKKLCENSIQFTLYDNSRLVGLSPCYFNDTINNIGYISAFIILDGYRKQGLGGKLLELIKIYGKEHSFTKLQVKIHCENNVLKYFYNKHGFSFANKENDWCSLEYEIR